MSRYCTLWTRKRGSKDWRHHGTPDSHNVKKRVQEWANQDPEYEYKLEIEKRTSETFYIKSNV